MNVADIRDFGVVMGAATGKIMRRELRERERAKPRRASVPLAQVQPFVEQDGHPPPEPRGVATIREAVAAC